MPVCRFSSPSVKRNKMSISRGSCAASTRIVSTSAATEMPSSAAPGADDAES